MRTLALIFLAGLVVLAVLLAAGRLAYARRIAALNEAISTAPAPVSRLATLPQPVRSFALRSGSNPDALARGVRFLQAAEMQLRPGQAWQRIDARQSIATGAPAFVWQARQPWGPVSKFQVLDAYAEGRGQLVVRLLGLLRIVRAIGPDIDRGEAMRYLAELPWAPDAILGNPEISWRQIDDTRAEATLQGAGWQASVAFRFDADGDIVEAFAPDRPATGADGRATLLPWRGTFSDYRRIGPRRIPARAEVGYVYPEGYRAYFRGSITEYSVLP